MTGPDASRAAEAELARVVRDHAGRLAASLVSLLGDFAAAEDLVSDAVLTALERWPVEGIPFRIPASEELATRLAGVLTVIYLLFNEGYLVSGGDAPQHRNLVDDAEWLASLLDSLMPTEPEVTGLLALIRLHRARAAARFDAAGNLVQLPDQDRGLCDNEVITAATRLLARAARHRRPGPYQLQAAIVACHAEARTWADTDWLHILVLYDMLLAHAPSPVTRLHRAIALNHVAGPEAALTELSTLDGVLGHYHLYHAARAELLRELDQVDQAQAADRRALELTANPAEQTLLRQRLDR